LINASRFFFFLRDTQAFFSVSFNPTVAIDCQLPTELNGWNWKMME
jgi:hypothetical protein